MAEEAVKPEDNQENEPYPWKFIEGKDSIPVDLYLLLMERCTSRKNLIGNDAFHFYLDALDDSVRQTAVDDNKIDKLEALIPYLTKTFKKDIQILECVQLLRSMNKKQNEHMEDYATRVLFFQDRLNWLLKKNGDALTQILFLSGLPFDAGELKEKFVDLLMEISVYRKGFKPKKANIVAKKKADVLFADEVKKEPPQEPLAVNPDLEQLTTEPPLTDFVIYDEYDEEESCEEWKPYIKEEEEEAFDEDYFEGADLYDSDMGPPKPPKKKKKKKKPKESSENRDLCVELKTSIQDIDWEKPIFQQFILDKSYSIKMVAVCSLCVKEGKREIIPTEQDFYRHAQREHARHTAICDHCPYSCRGNYRMASHRFRRHQAHTEGYELKRCTWQDCKFLYVYHGDFNSHVRTRHEKTEGGKKKCEKGGMCTQCGKSFERSTSLIRHIRTIHEGKKHKCELCERQFTNKKDLCYHTDKFHKGLGHLHEAICDQCGRKFITKAKMMAHVRKDHENIKNHECGICGKAFFRKINLIEHQRGVHQMGDDFKCPHCGRVMQSAHNLKIHIKLHLKKKEYHCKICNVWYTAVHALAYHITTKHMGFCKVEGNKKENIDAAKTHPAFERIIMPLLDEEMGITPRNENKD